MKRLSIEPLHRMRKILKDLQYNRFYRQENETQEPETITLPLDEIHYTTTIIGDLHDAYAATALMEKGCIQILFRKMKKLFCYRSVSFGKGKVRSEETGRRRTE
jgi:hypothetical protein